jgi:hypothetical protein
MHRTKIIAAILILIPCVLIALKFSYWNYTFKNILPQKKYEVGIDLSATGFNQPVSISTFLPQSDSRQTIIDEVNRVY